MPSGHVHLYMFSILPCRISTLGPVYHFSKPFGTNLSFPNFALQKPWVSDLFSGLGIGYQTERSTEIFMNAACVIFIYSYNIKKCLGKYGLRRHVRVYNWKFYFMQRGILYIIHNAIIDSLTRSEVDRMREEWTEQLKT
jgi:hypothetical protein